MKRSVFLTLILSHICFGLLGQVTLSVMGEKNVYPTWYYYTIGCTGHENKMDVQIEVLCSSHGSFSEYSNVRSKKTTIKKNQTSVTIPIWWKHTSASNAAYVEVKALNVVQIAEAKLNINEMALSPVIMNIPDVVLAGELFNIKFQSNTPYKNYGCSGDKLTITSGQGTKDMTARFDNSEIVETKMISGYADMDGQLGTRVFASKKNVEVLPNRIKGSSFVCYNDIGAYSYNIPSGASNIKWVSQNGKLNITSGQGTKSIQAKANPKSLGQETVVLTFDYRNRSFTVKFITAVGRPIVEKIYGPGVYGDEIKTSLNTRISLYADPFYSANEVEYVWDGPSRSEAIMQNHGYYCEVTFLQEGRYEICCYANYKGCPNPAPWEYRKDISILVGSQYYSINQQGSSGLVNIVKNEDVRTLKSNSKHLQYELRSLPVGTLKSSGNISVEGATLDFSNLPKGLYILNVIIDANNRAVRKIIIE